jgi:hypothetical protein
VILQPSVLALVAASLATSGLVLYAARWGVAVLRRWDLASGSSGQLELERRTYLVSTVLGYVLAFELASLFLYVHTADALAPLFTGAMCAAGTLAASPYGYPVLVLKLGNFVLAGLWLALNHADVQGYDYPLIRQKYAFLLALAPLVLAEAVLQALYFADLSPEVITSCCGSSFGRGSAGLAGRVAAVPMGSLGGAFYATVAAAAGAAILFRATGRGGWAVAALGALAIPVSLAALLSFVSPYVYELPTHQCPFCLLKREYGFVGYPLYATALGGGVAAVAVGMLAPFRRVASLSSAVPRLQQRLATAAAASLVVLLAIATWKIAASHLRM